jgi:hypothetical protein
MKTGQHVLVTTEFRGVFFGKLKKATKLPGEVVLTGARNCISWSADVGGFLGLAATGPSSTCKIGAKVGEVTLYKVTSITPVSKKAVTAWNSA